MEVGKYALVPEHLKIRGLVKNHINSYNDFIQNRLKKIVLDEVIRSEVNPEVHMRFTDIYIDDVLKIPQECRLAGLTYDAPIMVVVEYSDGHLERKTKRCIGMMPIMLRSCLCKLQSKSDKEFTSLGECPLDPGGYFIAKGIEKVMLIQEAPVKNKIMIDKDEKGCIRASVASNTDDKVASKTIIKLVNEKFYLELKPFQEKIPIMIVMRAMGMQSDQEVVQMIGGDGRFRSLFLASIEECAKLKVYTQSQALNFLESSKMPKVSAVEDPVGKGERALRILRDIFLANVPVLKNNFLKKCCHVVVMLRRIMEVILNKHAAMDDKDYVGNKRFELPGHLLSSLFEDLFKQMSCEARKAIDARLAKGRKLSDYDILKNLGGPIITKGLERTLLTGNWDANRLRLHRKGTTQVVSRFSYIGLLGQMTKIKAEYDKSRNARALHPSEWGMFCPCDTPVGEACGLEKNLALMTHVTIDEDDRLINKLCYTLGVEDLELISPALHATKSYFVILNGLILGKHRMPQKFTCDMRKLRRGGVIGKFVSIILNVKQGCVCIASDGGRVCRPLVIADNGVSRIKEHHMKDLRAGVRNFDSFIRDGLIEYLDADEENNSLIALCEKDTTADTTHIEIEQFTVFGVCAGLIPYPEHNPPLWDTYQCVMGRQAMGNIAYNQFSRMDPLINLLVYPQRPLLTTRTIELVGYDKLGAGQNATVAVMSYSGYDSDNAIVMNKSSLDRGFGRCIVMRSYSAVCQKYEHGWSDRIIKPQREGREAERMQVLDDDGIAAPGEIIRSRDIFINKESPIERGNPVQDPHNVPDSAFKSSRQEYKGSEGETAVVDKVALYTDLNGNLGIKLMIRQTRRPEVGDRFSSRHGQKGICGIIVQQEDLPFSERGICPDLIINPHLFPSRMTVGKMMELLGSKAAVSSCKIHLGTAFGESSGHADTVEAISETLVKHGFSYGGKDFLYSGVTGTPLQSYIFTGPIYYQKLKHMVQDKMHARGAVGMRSMLTREPIRGVYLGERDRDALIAYGASSVIHERMMGDEYDALVCQTCGLFGYYNHKMKVNMCSSCKSGESIATVKMPYACKLLFQELLSMNVVPRLKLGGLG